MLLRLYLRVQAVSTTMVLEEAVWLQVFKRPGIAWREDSLVENGWLSRYHHPHHNPFHNTQVRFFFSTNGAQRSIIASSSKTRLGKEDKASTIPYHQHTERKLFFFDEKLCLYVGISWSGRHLLHKETEYTIGERTSGDM